MVSRFNSRNTNEIDNHGLSDVDKEVLVNLVNLGAATPRDLAVRANINYTENGLINEDVEGKLEELEENEYVASKNEIFFPTSKGYRCVRDLTRW